MSRRKFWAAAFAITVMAGLALMPLAMLVAELTR